LHPALSPERGCASSSSGAGLLELEASAGTHLPRTLTHASELCIQMAFSQVATLGCKRLLVEGKWDRMVQNGTQRASLQISGGTSLMLLSAATHCPDHLRTRPADDSPPTTPPLPPALITADSLFGLRFHSEDERFAVKQIEIQIKNSFRGLDNCPPVQLGIKPDCPEWRYSIIELLCVLILCVVSKIKGKCQW
jgi:hypothetical protein